MIFCVKFIGADISGVPQTLLFSTVGFTTKPTDTPANTVSRERLIQPANFFREISSGKSVFGEISTSFGESVLNNSDGKLDYLTNYAFGWRSFELYVADDIAPFPSGWDLLLKATMDQVTFDEDVIRIRLRDRWSELSNTICNNKYTGTGGVNGGSELTGKKKQKVFGKCYNVEPVLLDKANQIYQMSDSTKVYFYRVRDKGDILSPGTARTSYADLVANTPSAGSFDYWHDGAMFRLGSPSVGIINCDIIKYNTTTANIFTDNDCYMGEVIKQIAIAGGVPSGDINSSDVAALTDGGREYGFVARDDDAASESISKIAQSSCVFVGFDRLGVLRMQNIIQPSAGTSVATLSTYNSRNLRCITNGDVTSLPVKSVTMNYPKNWTIMGSGDLATSVPSSGYFQVNSEFPYSTTTTVSTRHLNSKDLIVDVYTGAYVTTTVGVGDLIAGSGVSISKFVTLFGTDRQWFELDVPFRKDTLTVLDLNKIVTLVWDRYGLSSGKQMLIVGIRYDFSSSDPYVKLTLWG